MQDTAKFYLKPLQTYHLEHGLNINVFGDLRTASGLLDGQFIYGNPSKRMHLPLIVLETIAREILFNFDGINLKADF
jgi:hypothetical protein